MSTKTPKHVGECNPDVSVDIGMHVEDNFPNADRNDNGEKFTDAHCQHIVEGILQRHVAESFPNATSVLT